MKRLFSLLILLIPILAFSQNSWKADYSHRKVFVENKGQFDEYNSTDIGEVEYAADFGSTRIFFGKKGVKYVFIDTKKIPKTDREALAEKLPKGSIENHKTWEKLVGKFYFKSEEVNMFWENGNAKKIDASGLTKDYHSYSFKNNAGVIVNLNNVKGFEKITYKNIYPNIDIEYVVHSQIGIKYAIIVRPGADPNKVKMVYDRNIKLENGKVKISTSFGDIIDHEPISFHEFSDSQLIPSKFIQTTEKTAQFTIGNYDKKQTLIIDPWTQTPSFATNWDCVWECDKDATGNVYVLGGIMPMQVLKYNPTGTLLWTYNTPYDTSNVWLGTFATDLVGNTYITSGSTAQIQKINTSAGLVWNNSSPVGGLTNAEFWTITFNCDQTKLVVGGTGGSALTLNATVYDINVTSGAVIQSQNFATGSATSFPPAVQEIRSICASPSGKYYFLTQDTIGSFNQIFNLCTANSSLLFKNNSTYNFGYKCENYRYDNSGIAATRTNNNFLYTQNGSNVHKRNLQTGAIITTSTIPGGNATTSLGDFLVSNSGLDLDGCGNVYVGSSTGVVKYDANLVQLATYATTFKVYDVHVSINGDILAAGSTGTSSSNTRSGSIQVFAASACAPLAANCCNATICPVQSLCATASPITLTAATPGGTWSGPGMSANGTFNPTTAGSGTHTITYTLPCGFESIQIVVSPCQTLNVCQESNGSLTVSNGVAPYSWQSQSTVQNCAACLFGCTVPPGCAVNVLAWTTYTTGTTVPAPTAYPIRVLDNSGTILIINSGAGLQPCNAVQCPTLIATPTSTNITCNGLTNGIGSVSTTGGASPYTYSWTGGTSTLTGASQNNLAAGTYSIAILDAANCPGSTTITITSPSIITLSSSNIVSAACETANGAATVNALGGTGAYTYSWSPSGGTGATTSNILGGNYTVTVLDANLCTQTLSIIVPNTGGPTITNIAVVNVSCSNATSGQFTVTSSGGSGALTYQLGTGTPQTSNVFGNLAAGTYIVTVIDANNCTNSSTATILAPTLFTLAQGTIISADCGATNGGATVLVTNGSGNYTFDWNPSTNATATATAIAAGVYMVTVTDQTSGCVDSLQFIVPALGAPTLTLTNSSTLCFGSSNGTITANAIGGTGPYTYSLGTGTPQASANFNNLTAGTYQVTVFDANNCPATQSTTITSPTQVVATTAVDVSICIGQSTTLSGSGTGGTGAITVSWSNGLTSSNPSVSPTATTTYTMTATDGNGCSATDGITITVLPLPNAQGSPTSLAGSAPLAVNFSNFSTNATNYVWSFGNGQNQSSTTTANVNTTYLAVGTYTVTLVASNGLCSDTWEGSITVIPIGEIVIEIPNVFSPNADNSNDVYGIFTINAASQEAAIYNRWGNKIVELNTPNATWDGKVGGTEAVDGVYFLKYRIVGINGYEKEGQTFLHLIR